MLLGVDVGGTFTDAVLIRGDGSLVTAKVATTARDESIGVLEAVDAVLSGEHSAVTRFAHGMTVATNAVLQGITARTALLCTEGFTDLVELGRQARPELYRLCVAPPPPLVPPELRFAVPERMTPHGPLQTLCERDAAALVERVAKCEARAVAVVLLHSYAHPEHELLLGRLLAAKLPNAHVSLSHQLVGTFREYERAASTELDAAVSPLLAGYLRSLAAAAKRTGLPSPQIMQSSGGLTDVQTASAHAALTVLSGPAGGVGGALLLARLAGQRDLLFLDMGGTSCDVALALDGEVAETDRRRIAHRPLALPSLDIHTVGAGGGSIASRDAGGALRVGPRSAGASPGPACYGRGGLEPTVTDANLVLGRLPAATPLPGGLRLDLDAAREAVGALARQLGLELHACAEGIVRVAELEMLGALRVVSVRRGIDPRELALLAFGGAGPLHAASLARELGIGRVLCPRASGVLCALGLAAAAPRRDAVRSVLLADTELTAERLAAELDELIELACSASADADDDEEDEDEGDAPHADQRAGSIRERSRTSIRVLADVRYRGQSHELTIALARGDGPAELKAAFAAEHESRYGYRDEHAQIELVTLRVSAFGEAPEVRIAAARSNRQERPGERSETDAGDTQADGPPSQARRACDATARSAGDAPARDPATTPIFHEGSELDAALIDGPPPAGTRLSGPAVCSLGESTLFVPPRWSGVVDEHGTIVLDDEERSSEPASRGAGEPASCGAVERSRGAPERASGGAGEPASCGVAERSRGAPERAS